MLDTQHWTFCSSGLLTYPIKWRYFFERRSGTGKNFYAEWSPMFDTEQQAYDWLARWKRGEEIPFKTTDYKKKED